MSDNLLSGSSWMGVALLILVFVIIARRIKRKGGAYRGAVIAATYDLHGRDQRHALEVILEEKAEYRDSEHSAGVAQPSDVLPHKTAARPRS